MSLGGKPECRQMRPRDYSAVTNGRLQLAHSPSRTLTVVNLDKNKQRQGLRDSHDRSKRERIAMSIVMSIVMVRNSTFGVAEDFSARLTNRLVIAGHTRLAETLAGAKETAGQS